MCSEGKFECGYIQLQLQVESGIITRAEIFSDAMDWQLPVQLETALSGCRFTLPDMEKALEGIAEGNDICDLLAKQSI